LLLGEKKRGRSPLIINGKRGGKRAFFSLESEKGKKSFLLKFQRCDRPFSSRKKKHLVSPGSPFLFVEGRGGKEKGGRRKVNIGFASY